MSIVKSLQDEIEYHLEEISRLTLQMPTVIVDGLKAYLQGNTEPSVEKPTIPMDIPIEVPREPSLWDEVGDTVEASIRKVGNRGKHSVLPENRTRFDQEYADYIRREWLVMKPATKRLRISWIHTFVESEKATGVKLNYINVYKVLTGIYWNNRGLTKPLYSNKEE